MLKKRYVKTRGVCKVTFELPLDEAPEGVQPISVALVGEFNGWDPTANPMERRKDAFRLTLELEPGEPYQFRYLVNGVHWCNDWHADGYVPNDLGEDNSVVVSGTPPRGHK